MNTEESPYASIQFMGKTFSDKMDEAAKQTIHNVARVLMPLAAQMEEWPSGYIEIKDTGTFSIHSFPPKLRDQILELLK